MNHFKDEACEFFASLNYKVQPLISSIALIGTSMAASKSASRYIINVFIALSSTFKSKTL